MNDMKFGLIGHPVAHSLSPALFRAGYDGKYTYDLIEGEDFEKSYEKFIKEYDGINVTAPFKELAYEKADIVSDECRIIKAANMLVKTPEGIKAFNSDYLGVRLWLREILGEMSSDSCTDRTSARVLIVGCGGAGKAAAVAAASLDLHVILMNRDRSKAETLAGSIGQMKNGHAVVQVLGMEEFRNAFREADIIIYNIPLAVPALAELTDIDFRGGETPRQKHILEANYRNPSFCNKLIDKMIQANPHATYTKGQKWLLYQAVTGYNIFTGDSPDLSSMQDVI